MLQLRKSEDRGRADLGWLDSRHTFSFGDYYDPSHMGFGPLRVINDDRVAGGGGFGEHGHANMEIVTYVLSGALEHRDSLGNGSIIRPGDVQRMSAGTGIRHSEFNASQTEAVHFLQIWIVPEAKGLAPGYEQTTIATAQKQGRLCLIGARDGRDGAVTIHQNAEIYASVLSEGDSVVHSVEAGRGAWVHVASGAAEINGMALGAGDGLAVRDVGELLLTGKASQSEVLLFDLAV